MKTGKYFITLSIYILLGVGSPISSFASDEATKTYSVYQNSNSHLDHDVLARQHERLAKEMQAKVQEKEAILKTKPSTSFFGKNGRYLKSRIVNKIREYDQVAQENLKEAAYHRAIASGQASGMYVAEPNKMNSQINKARIKSYNPDGL